MDKTEEMLWDAWHKGACLVRVVGIDEPPELCGDSLCTLRTYGTESVTLTGEEWDALCAAWLRLRPRPKPNAAPRKGEGEGGL